MEFEDTGEAPELEIGRGVQVRVGETAVAVFRTPDGLRALDDRCAHAGAPLSGGICEDGVVICPWHAFRYDVATGACLIGGGRPGVRSRAVRVENGRLFVER
jgi:nitrite reductase/ring-hydroxylating ferredoxin subunit